MSRENFEKFRQIVLEDLSLQNQLNEIERRDEFIERVVDLARERKIEITNDDVAAALSESRRAWLEKWV